MDWVCLDEDSCATNFPWMNIKSVGLSDDLNGVLGACADPSMITDDVAPSYIEQLYNESVIDEQVFAIALRDVNDDESSYIDVGFYDDTNAIPSRNSLVWIDVADDETYGQLWWHNYMTGLRFRSQTTSDLSYSDSVTAADEVNTDGEQLAILDSGTSCIKLPTDLYDFVL